MHNNQVPNFEFLTDPVFESILHSVTSNPLYLYALFTHVYIEEWKKTLSKETIAIILNNYHLIAETRQLTPILATLGLVNDEGLQTLYREYDKTFFMPSKLSNTDLQEFYKILATFSADKLAFLTYGLTPFVLSAKNTSLIDTISRLAKAKFLNTSIFFGIVKYAANLDLHSAVRKIIDQSELANTATIEKLIANAKDAKSIVTALDYLTYNNGNKETPYFYKSCFINIISLEQFELLIRFPQHALQIAKGLVAAKKIKDPFFLQVYTEALMNPFAILESSRTPTIGYLEAYRVQFSRIDVHLWWYLEARIHMREVWPDICGFEYDKSKAVSLLEKIPADSVWYSLANRKLLGLAIQHGPSETEEPTQAAESLATCFYYAREAGKEGLFFFERMNEYCRNLVALRHYHPVLQNYYDRRFGLSVAAGYRHAGKLATPLLRPVSLTLCNLFYPTRGDFLLENPQVILLCRYYPLLQRLFKEGFDLVNCKKELLKFLLLVFAIVLCENGNASSKKTLSIRFS